MTGNCDFSDNSQMRTFKLAADATPLAREVNKRMVERGIPSMSALAAGAKVSYDFIRDIFRGKSLKPNGQELAKVAAFLGCSSEQLLNPGRPEQLQEDEKKIKTPEELTWIRIWRRASDYGRSRLMAAAQEAMLGDLTLGGETKDI